MKRGALEVEAGGAERESGALYRWRAWPAERRGMVLGFLGVAGFSLTLPATRAAVAAFSPVVVGLGRAVVAACLALIVLAALRQRRPTARQLRGLVIVAAGVIVGFPLLSAWAMTRLPSVHGAVVLALLPLASAGAAILRAGERPSGMFWLASAVGCAAVLAYAVLAGLRGLEPADLALIGAVLAAALGYAEGGRLAREMGGWQVISWALVIAAPFLALAVLPELSAGMLHAPLGAWMGFLYVSVVSQFLAFFAWYEGLALGGIARVSQLQYVQPFLTVLGSALLLGEAVTPAALAALLIVVAAVYAGRKAAVARPNERMR